MASTVQAIRDVAGGWALPIMALSLVGSDVANAYTGMLALAGIASCLLDVRDSVRVRVIGSVIVIALGTGCALLGYREFVNNLSNFLNVLLFVFIPWSAINLTDYYLVRHGNYDIPSFFTPKGQYRGFLWRGLAAYLLSVAVEVPFISQTFYTGPLVKPLGGIDISWVVGGIAGIAFYLLAVRIRHRHQSGQVCIVPLWARPGPPTEAGRLPPAGGDPTGWCGPRRAMPRASRGPAPADGADGDKSPDQA